MTNTLASFKRNLHVGGMVTVKSALYPQRDGQRVVLALHQRNVVTGIPVESPASQSMHDDPFVKPVTFEGKSYYTLTTVYQPTCTHIIAGNATVIRFMSYYDNKAHVMQPSPDFVPGEEWLSITIEK